MSSTWPLTVTTIDSPVEDVAIGIWETSILLVTCEFLLGGGVIIRTGPTCVTAPVFVAPNSQGQRAGITDGGRGCRLRSGRRHLILNRVEPAEAGVGRVRQASRSTG